MSEDERLNQIRRNIQTRLVTYRRRLAKPGLRKRATAKKRIEQSRLLLTIIQAAQRELIEGYKPADTIAQLDDMIRECSRTSKFSSTLGGLANSVKGRIKTQRGSKRTFVRAEQSSRWNKRISVFNVLTRVAGSRQRHNKIDVQFAIQVLGSDGQYYPVDRSDRGYSDQIARLTLNDGTGIASCHPTASALQEILGHENGYNATAGGRGRAKRSEAIRLASLSLQANKPARVIWLKGTATSDGHSFTLVKKPSGRVDVIESWANPEGNGYLLTLGNDPEDGYRLKYGITRQNALTAVNRLNAVRSDDRDMGYASFSVAYGDVEDNPASHFELFRDDDEIIHDSDANISLLCTVRDLASYATVKNRMTARYQVISGLKFRLGI